MVKALNRSTAMSVRIRRRNEFLEFFIRKFAVCCAHCNEPIDPREFYSWRDSLVIRHHDNDAKNDAVENIDIMHRSCHHSVVAKQKRAGSRLVHAVIPIQHTGQ